LRGACLEPGILAGGVILRSLRTEMRIESLPPERLEDAVELWRQTGLVRPWNDPLEDARRALARPASTVLAGFDGETLLATAMVGHDGHRGWVYYVAVSPRAQGRGYGRAIMTACEAWLRERHVPKLNLTIRNENAAARGFYQALSYSPDDVVVLSHRLDEQ
jgi:ribosomal protein S18 acetylase RimI-like enzyme